MKIPPDFLLTPDLALLLGKIETFKNLGFGLGTSRAVNQNLRRQSLLGSSLFSARIEGNTLRPEEITANVFNSDERQKREVANLYRALNYVYENYPPEKNISIEDLLTWHSLTLNKISPQAGKLRAEMGGVFDTFGNLVHFSTPPQEIRSQLEKLLDYVNSTQDDQVLAVKACLCHYVFEKIHPFLDANGRVGRLLLSGMLNQYGYSLGGLLVLEEYLDEHRSAYYAALDESEKNIGSYLLFMLEALSFQLLKTQKSLVNLSEKGNFTEAALLPRRGEILNIIREHQLINFDFIRRRFLAVNQRTLRHDLKKLADGGFIIKRGETRGVFYAPVEKEMTDPNSH